MAGGRFNKRVGKVRPGTYINFKSTRRETISGSERGTVIIPLSKHTYGPPGEFILINSENPDGASAKLGYSIYDSGENRQMLYIREALKKALKVYVYRINGGTAATAAAETSGGLAAAAKYPGTRGNDLSYTITANPVDGFDVYVHLGTSKVSEYNGLKTVADLIAQNNEYITFTGSGNLAANAGVKLTNGADAELENTDVTKFLDNIESVAFNTLCFPFTDASLQAAAKNKIKYLREQAGKGVQVVMPNTKSADYEGVINLTNAVDLNGDKLSVSETCAWVAAATAAATNTQSNTYAAYDGATDIVGKKSHEDAVAAINNGEFFFSINEDNKVVVEYDINSLITYSDGKDKTYRKNRVIRVFDTFSELLQLNFPPNAYENSENGWNVMEGIGKSLLQQMEKDADGNGNGAIKNVNTDEDFAVDRTISSGDETFFNVGLEPVDSSEKLYFTIATR